jgi:5'-nucleotidase/UDP-sugar diphosphatase
MKPACRARGAAPAEGGLPAWLNALAKFLRVGLCCLLLSLASACGTTDSSSVPPTGGGAGFIASDPNVRLSSQPPTFTLQILHASDLEASVAAVQDAPRFSAVINALRPQFPNTVVLSSGDTNIPSPFYNASADPSLRGRYDRTPGKADMEILKRYRFLRRLPLATTSLTKARAKSRLDPTRHSRATQVPAFPI